MEFIEMILNSISGLLFVDRNFKASWILRSIAKLFGSIGADEDPV